MRFERIVYERIINHNRCNYSIICCVIGNRNYLVQNVCEKTEKSGERSSQMDETGLEYVKSRLIKGGLVFSHSSMYGGFVMKFRLVGTTVPAVEVYYDQAGEEMITQSGGMSWMSDGIDMTSDTNGGVMAGLGRMFAGESMFMARYRALRPGATIAFASKVPGSIVPVKMKDHPSGLICQKGAFLCSQSTVNLEVTFSKKFSSGLFGGGGLFWTHITGPGKVILQTQNIKDFAGVLSRYMPTRNNM